MSIVTVFRDLKEVSLVGLIHWMHGCIRQSSTTGTSVREILLRYSWTLP